MIRLRRGYGGRVDPGYSFLAETRLQDASRAKPFRRVAENFLPAVFADSRHEFHEFSPIEKRISRTRSNRSAVFVIIRVIRVSLSVEFASLPAQHGNQMPQFIFNVSWCYHGVGYFLAQ
jgi:hypothetical protein